MLKLKINKENLNSPNHSHSYKYNLIHSSRFIYKPKKKIGNTCYCLNALEKNGPINIIINSSKTFISKIKLIKFDDDFDELLEKGKSNINESDPNITSSQDKSFYYQRYYYYSKYDEGIKMDKECWWSVTPEIIAEYTAKISKGYSVIDGFCGSGGNVIQFSKYGSKVYAIDIDDKKLDICKNNCKVYNCDDNISFIHCDFLKIDNYSNEKVYADYIFLSPPWGGIEYKNSDVYSIKKLMTPSIYDIIKMCLKVSKYIMFYVPRTLLLEELFNIISEITGNDRLFFDVHILKSANKIKALLIIFGYNIKDKILESDIEEYIRLNYEPYKISERNLEILLTISKLIGCYKFFQNEYDYRNYLIHEYNESNLDIGNEVIKYFFNKILTEQEKIKLKSLNNLFNPKVFHYKKATSIDKESIKNTRINIYKSYSNQIIFSSPTPLNSTNSSISSNKSNNGKHTWVLEEANEISIQFLSDNSM